MFATHYHCLAGEQKEGMVAAHMACMVENEGHEDISQENITFLYKLSEGAAPKSHGFNAAKLAGLPHDIIRAGYAKAKEFEQREQTRCPGAASCMQELVCWEVHLGRRLQVRAPQEGHSGQEARAV